jgi:hypothetical protein
MSSYETLCTLTFEFHIFSLVMKYYCFDFVSIILKVKKPS